jgi:hypothetical protein
VVITNLDVIGVPRVPFETDPPLIIDSDTPLTGPIARQLFQAIADWYPQVSKIARSVQLLKLHQCPTLNAAWELPREPLLPHFLSVAVAEASDHAA